MKKRVPCSLDGKLMFRQPLLLSALLVASCATVAPPVSAPEPTVKAAVAKAAEEAAAQQQAVTAAPRPDNGINRTGRVIQLGRRAEPAPTGQPPQNNVVSLNYEQEDFRTVIEQLGDALGINMVIDPTIDYKVSLRTSSTNPLRYQDIWPLLRLLARSAGVTIEQAGNVWRFSRNASNIPAEIVLPSTLSQATASEVLQVTPLTYISVKTLEPILTPLLQPAGQIIHMGEANLVGIFGTPAQLQRINNLLSVIDDDPFQNQGIQLYQLRNSPAQKVAEELTGVLKLIEGEQSSYHVLGLDRINSVLVVAPANRGFTEVDRWVNILDAESSEQAEQLFVYKVKNLEAKDLSETLGNAFGERQQQQQNGTGRNQQQNNNQNNPLQQILRLPQPNANNAAGANNNTGAAIVAAGPPGLQALASALNGGATGGTGTSANLNVSIVSDEKSNSLLVRATPREYRQLLNTISQLDAVPLQVLINAVIGQVTLNEGNEFGIDWTRVSANAASRVSGQFLPLPGDATNSLLTNPRGLPNAASGFVLTRSFMDGATQIDAALKALAQDNEVRLLSRPTILAANNQEGTIKVGENVPINNGSTVTAVGTTNSISYRDVGIVLTITPHINEEGYINLTIEQTLSSLSPNTSGVAGNPSFVNQEIKTTVVVADQATITLGGLIQEEATDQQSGIPFLQKIPVLGRAFSYNQLDKARKELFVILRPQIVYGDQRDAATLAAFREKFTEVGKLLNKAGL